VAKPKPAAAAPKRLWLQLNSAGQLDLARLPDGAKQRLRAWYSDANFLAGLGLVGQPAEPAEPEFPFTEREAAALWKCLGEAQAWLLGRALSLPPEACAVLRFSDAERALLGGPTVRVLAKYAPTWLPEHKDEAALILLLLAIEQGKISRALALKREAESRPAAAEDRQEAA